MLTNIFYYNYYKPYIVRNAETVPPSPRKSKITERTSVELSRDPSVLLNKSRSAGVLKFARGVSNNVLSTKETAKNLVRDMEDFNKNTQNEGIEKAEEWITDGIGEFTGAYNDTVDFLKEQSHSGSLANYVDELASKLSFNAENLAMLGLGTDDNGRLTFDAGTFRKLDHSAVNTAIGMNINFFETVYQDTSEMMLTPLAEHMNFKNLGYYYNYRLGTMQADTFKIIETGMLVDEAV